MTFAKRLLIAAPELRATVLRTIPLQALGCVSLNRLVEYFDDCDGPQSSAQPSSHAERPMIKDLGMWEGPVPTARVRINHVCHRKQPRLNLSNVIFFFFLFFFFFFSFFR